jgi:DNA replication protein DnaC
MSAAPDVLLKAYLKTLRLPTMLREYPQTARQCGEENRQYEEFLCRLAERESTVRETNAIARRIREADFPAAKELSEFNFARTPSISKRRVLELGKPEWLEKRENVVLIGDPGVGKTHLAIALGREACRRGRRVRFFTAAGLATTYREARAEREVRRLERHIATKDLVIVDELGYVSMAEGDAENLFGFFSRCYEKTSVIVTTNLPFTDWAQIFTNERLAGALIDRLTHRVHLLDFGQEESERARQSKARLEKLLAGEEGGEG